MALATATATAILVRLERCCIGFLRHSGVLATYYRPDWKRLLAIFPMLAAPLAITHRAGRYQIVQFDDA